MEFSDTEPEGGRDGRQAGCSCYKLVDRALAREAHDDVMLRLAEPRSPRPPEAEPRASVGDEANAVVAGLMPWVISILLHAGLAVIALFALWSTMVDDDAEEIIVPMVELSETPGAPLEMRAEQRVRDRATDRREIVQDEPADAESELAMDAEAGADAGLVGVAGDAGAGAESPFGTEVASGAEFRTSFMGARGGNVRRVAFLIDASGSLIDTFPFVIEHLTRTINNLSERQEFTVIFFQGNDVIEVPVPRRGLRSATGENKQRVIEWIDPASHNIVPRGLANPIPALELALRYRPDAIFLLSDNITGRGPYAVDQRQLLNAIRRANQGGTNISTIQFLYEDDLARLGLKGTMELIAEEHAGDYVFVDERRLGLMPRRDVR